MCAQFGVVSGSEVQTPSSGVQMNGAALRDAALAPGRLGAEIGQDVGGLFSGISQQIQESRNARKVFDADMAMRNTKDQFLSDISTDPKLASDPNTWVPALNERVKATQEAIMGQKDLGPLVKAHLNKVTAIWGMDTISEVRTQALRREAADTKDAGEATAMRALQDGDENTAIAAYKALAEHGLMGPKELAQKIAMAPQVAAISQANVAIGSNPIDSPRLVESLKDKLTPMQYKTARSQAFEAQSRAQTQNAQEYAAAITDSPIHAIDDSVILEARERGQISVPQYRKLLEQQKAYVTTDRAAQNAAESDSMAEAMLVADSPPTDAQQLESWATEIKNQGLAYTNPRHRLLLNHYVDSKVQSVRKAGVKDDRPIQNQMFSLMDEDRKSVGVFIPMGEKTETSGWLWDRKSKQVPVAFGGGLTNLQKLTDDQAEQFYGKGMTAKKVLAAEQLNYAKKREAMRNWFDSQEQAGKKPTIEEANDYRMKLEEPHIINTVLAMSGNQPDITKDAYDQLSKGDTFYYKGKRLTKK